MLLPRPESPPRLRTRIRPGVNPAVEPVELLAAGYQRIEGDRRIDWNNARRATLYSGGYVVLQCSLDGAGWFRDQTGRVELTPGLAFLAPVPSPTGYGLTGGATWEWVWIGFRGALAGAVTAAVNRSAGHVLDLADTPVIAMLCDVYDTAAGPDPPSSWALSARLYAILTALAERFVPAGGAEPEPVRTARDYIEQHFDDPGLDLQELAESAGLSKFHFARLFRDATGQSPGAYLRRRRLTCARDLLAFTDLPVKLVAAQSGFASATYFCAAFRKAFGQTPNSVRGRRA